MKALFSVIITFALASLILIGSSGTFVSFEASREVRVQVVPHEREYIGFDCEDNYSAVVEVGVNSGTDFDALTIRNYLNELKDVWVWLNPDYSELPSGVEMTVESEDGVERMIASGEEYTFAGHVDVGNVEPGEYTIPVTIYARWIGGDAVIASCPIKLIIRGGPTIKKELISGDLEVPTHTYEQWTFRITVTSPDIARNLTVRDVIPGEFDIDSIVPSEGTFTVTQTGAAHHITWEVELEANGSASLDVTIHTKLNPAGKQEFTSCGEYPLNEGAEIVGYDIRSNGINVTAKCESEGDCKLCVASYWISGPAFLKVNRAASYHTMIVVKNRGSEKDVTITQYVGKYFTLENYAPSKGTVSMTNLPDGKTLVTWSLHLSPGELATLNLYEHTDGIDVPSNRNVLLVSRPCVVGCGCVGCSKYVYVYRCGCHSSGDTPPIARDVNEIDDLAVESESDMEACEG